MIKLCDLLPRDNLRAGNTFEVLMRDLKENIFCRIYFITWIIGFVETYNFCTKFT